MQAGVVFRSGSPPALAPNRRAPYHRAMRLLTLTDLHGNDAALNAILEAAGPVDIMLLGGDITNFGSPQDAERLVRRAQSTGTPVWAVAGNCDSAEIDQRLVELGVSLHGRGVIYQGLGLHGISAMPPWGHRMYQFTEAELAEFLCAGSAQLAAAKTRVVLSHAPPHGVRDRTHLFQHPGSAALREFILRTVPTLVVCGHIHEGRGVDFLGATTVVNCGAAKSGHYALAEVEEGGRVEVDLRRA
jgi:uncharacterized protein